MRLVSDLSFRPHYLRATLVALLAVATGWAAEDADERFVEGLLQRQLYRLAELHCEQQLERENLDDGRRAELVIQLLKAYTQHAINVPRTDRQAIWDKSSQAWSVFRDSIRDVKLWPDVAFQYWISEITRGEILRLEAEVSADRETDLAEATGLLRQSVRALRDLQENVKQLQRNPNRDRSRWPDRKLRDLLNQIRITIAQAMLQQSACYRPGSPDNVHLLSQARDGFAALARLTGNSELTQLSHLGQMECHRRLRDFATARDKQERLAANESLSPKVQWKLVNEMASLRIDQDSPQQAIDLLQRQLKQVSHQVDPNIAAQTELTLIRAYIAAWKAAVKSSSSDSEQWRTAAISQLQRMEKSLPKYWVRRAEILLSSIQSASNDLADVDILSRSAAHQFRRQNYSEAINTYRRAAKLAGELKDPHLAFDLDYQAAAILLHVKDYAKARDAFQEVAFGYPTHINAARAHLTAVTCAARLAPDSSADLRRYETMLSDQIRRWPEDPSVDQARLWLAMLQQQKGNWAASVDNLIVINDTFPQIADVRERIRLGFEKLLAGHDLHADEKEQLGSRAAEYFERIVRNVDDLQSWDQDRREAAIDTATFRILHTTDDSSSVARTLDAAVASEGSTALWRTRARALSGLAYALMGDPLRARQRLDDVDWSRIDNGLDYLKRLERAIHASGDVRGKELASIMLRISQAVTATDAEQKRQLAQYQADASDLLGQRQDALRIYQQLMKQAPDDVRIRYRSAQLWEQGRTPQDHQRAMDHWRYTVRLSKPASELWFEAKLGIARTHLALGNSQRAAEVIQLTQALHPDLGGDQMKRRFQTLLSQTQ